MPKALNAADIARELEVTPRKAAQLLDPENPDRIPATVIPRADGRPLYRVDPEDFRRWREAHYSGSKP